MNVFKLQIVTPDGVLFDGDAEKLIARCVMGDVCILANHADFVSPLGKGDIKITELEENTRIAACEGGFMSVKNGAARVVSDNFKWKTDIS